MVSVLFGAAGGLARKGSGTIESPPVLPRWQEGWFGGFFQGEMDRSWPGWFREVRVFGVDYLMT